MLACNRTRQHWHVPTPLQLPGDGKITIAIHRPTMRTLILSVALVTAAAVGLSAFGLQDHTAVGASAYTLCVVIANLICRGNRWSVTESRTGLVCLSALLFVAIWPGDVTGGPLPVAAVAGVALVSLVGEVAFRLAERRGLRCAPISGARLKMVPGK
jgi:hypothetical protein